MAPSPRGGSWEAWARGGGGPGPAGSAGSAGSVGGGCSSSGGEDAWGDWEERVGAALGALAGPPSRQGFGAAALEDLSAAPDLPCCRHWPAVAATLPGLLRRPSCRAGAAGLLDALWADLVPSGSPQLLDLFEAAAADLVGGVPPLPPGACRRVAAWASALPALSRAWPEHAVGRLGAALAALLQPGEPHFRPVALALPPPRDFLDFCVSGSMRLEAALLRGLESSTAFAQALATFEALAFPPEAEGAPRPPVPERGALVAVGRACGPVAAPQQPRRPGNVAAFVEDAGPGRAAWLLALLGEAVVHLAALRGGPTGWEGGTGGRWRTTPEDFCVFLFDVLFSETGGDAGLAAVAASALSTAARLVGAQQAGHPCFPACIAAHIAKGLLAWVKESLPAARPDFAKNMIDVACSAGGLETRSGQGLCERCAHPSGPGTFVPAVLECCRALVGLVRDDTSEALAEALLEHAGGILSRDLLSADPDALRSFQELLPVCGGRAAEGELGSNLPCSPPRAHEASAAGLGRIEEDLDRLRQRQRLRVAKSRAARCSAYLGSEMRRVI